METLKNCDIITDIEEIIEVRGASQRFEVLFVSGDKRKHKIVFEPVWDIRCAIENAYIDRGTRFVHGEDKESGILLVENSEYVRYFMEQVSGTRPTDEIMDYILFDSVDNIVEILTVRKPCMSDRT